MTELQLRAKVLLTEAAALGLTVDDLIAADAETARPLPTLAEWIDTVAATFTPRTAATYRSYWRLAVAQLGERRLAGITIVDLQAVVVEAGRRARQRRPGGNGRASQESCLAALRAVFSRAVGAGLIATNPAAGLQKPRRARSRRRALDDTELAELIDAVRTTSRDPDLDLLLVRFHLESGARREGALNLVRRDLDQRRATVWLREKSGSEREQPVSPSLVTLLERHALSRGATTSDAQVFRTRRGIPISERRYSTVFGRARRGLSWAARTPVSAHVLRHTAITAVGRYAGYPVAQAFAGHTPPSVTGRYMHVHPAEVAATIAALTGEPHPLAAPQHNTGACSRAPQTVLCRP